MPELEQAVVEETKGQAAPVPEATSAREDDLDTLLNQYDQVVKPPASPQPEPKPAVQAPPVADAAQSDLAEVRQFIFDQDMTRTVGKVRGDLDPEFFDDALIKGWINEQAVADPRLTQAWINRRSNPKQFEKVVDTLGRNFAKKYSKLPDRQATDDREAVTAAVRGASNTAPLDKPPAYGEMSNPEYRKSVKEKYGFDPGV